MERRRSPRLPIQLELKARSGEVEMEGFTINLSLTGACILVNAAPRDFDSIEFTCSLPIDVEGKMEIFEVTFPGVVVRAEPTDSRTIVAIMFQKTPIEAEWALSKFLLALLDES